MKFRIHAQCRKTGNDAGPRNKWTVSIMQETDEKFLQPAESISQYTGTGYCYGDALAELKMQLDNYISALTKFRDEIMDTQAAYQTAAYIKRGDTDD